MSSMTRPSTLPADPDRSPEVDRALAWLQAEQNAAESPAYTSMLLHESAVVLDGADDEEAAQKQYRAALSLEPAFREPLEQLLALYERHGRLAELTELYRHLRGHEFDEHRTQSCATRVRRPRVRTDCRFRYR